MGVASFTPGDRAASELTSEVHRCVGPDVNCWQLIAASVQALAAFCVRDSGSSVLSGLAPRRIHTRRLDSN